MFSHQSFILANVAFIDLTEQLTVLGWQRVSDPTAPEPFILGEPELAEWRRRCAEASDARLVYTFAPSSGLRALMVELPRAEDGVYADALRAALPHLAAADVAALLRSDDSRACLRGIQAAALLRDPALIAPLNELLGIPSPTIAREARAALATLLEQAARDATTVLRRLDAWRGVDSARAFNRALFTAIDEPRQRRQALRWIMRQQHRATPEIEAVLAAALDDADWEVRATAMLAAARLGATRLRQAVQRVALPATQKEGVDADDRRILAALRVAALRLLAGEPIPPAATDPPSDRAAMTQHIMRCAAGSPVSYHDRVYLLVYSLSAPFEVPEGPEAQPPHLPGLATRDGTHWLGEIELIWIPPVAGWLGDDLPRAPIANPIRLVERAGYFISRQPLLDQRGLPLTLGWEAAVDRCARLAAAHGLRVRIPTADEWELAARGPDGRRFPWGNALTRDFAGQPSPWGLAAAVGVCAQWCYVDDRPILCGGVDQLRCSMRKPSSGRDIQAALRIVVDS